MKVLTANRLTNGEAVWLAADHSWTPTIQGAEIALDEATEEKLIRAGKAALCKNEVVDVNLIDVELVDGVVRPVRLRERIRAAGPTNRRDLGKQAERFIAVAA
ncbi:MULTISPECIES: DUF2849 domain-containing protein [unclassified Aminobacter]|uniref:DUF2849 domain-containing protein n=1 Tax=unclassified Aminobacter TaxID=2644704 RepID=UPI0004656A13|nr:MULTISPECIES: DUF2849 domain-containing protein [unclassified Aminobacter]TWG49161.1 uncharacterized protein DUF2849 [Aminobacter sp. J44]TWH30841.1 uncharacterized protein DUF2849 [Aminobacter sp. J15]